MHLRTVVEELARLLCADQRVIVVIRLDLLVGRVPLGFSPCHVSPSQTRTMGNPAERPLVSGRHTMLYRDYLKFRTELFGRRQRIVVARAQCVVGVPSPQSPISVADLLRCSRKVSPDLQSQLGVDLKHKQNALRSGPSRFWTALMRRGSRTSNYVAHNLSFRFRIDVPSQSVNDHQITLCGAKSLLVLFDRQPFERSDRDSICELCERFYQFFDP